MSRINLRDNRDYSDVKTFRKFWVMEQYSRLRKFYSEEEIGNKELQQIILNAYNDRYLVEGRFYSNITGKNTIMTQEQFTDWFFNEDQTLTGYGTLFDDPDKSERIIIKALEFLTDQRNINRSLMAKQEYGSHTYTMYNILQTTYKLLGNSYYGITGAGTSIFFNPAIQNSITLTGQDLTTNAIIFIEMFISNNVKHYGFDSIIRLIEHVDKTKPKHNIRVYVDNVPTIDQIIESFDKNTEGGLSDENKKRLEKMLLQRNKETTTRIYYKNKFREFFENHKIKNLMMGILKYPFETKVAPEVESDLNLLTELVMDFVYLDLIIEDRYRRVTKHTRLSVVGSDTDSVFINFGNEVVNFNESLNLNHEDEVVQLSLVNTLIHLASTAMDKYMDLTMMNFGVKEKYRPIINMDPEYLYKRMLFTRNKKSYSGIITAKLGKALPEPDLDIKGMAIRKTTVSKRLRDEFSEILLKDMLEEENISLKTILSKFNKLGKDIEESLKAGSLEYAIPKNISQLENYKHPLREEQIRGMIVWNEIFPDDPVVAPDKVNFLKTKNVGIDDPIWKDLKEKDETMYLRLLKVVHGGHTETAFNAVAETYKELYGEEEMNSLRVKLAEIDDVELDISHYGFSGLTIPQSVENLPEEIRPFIDYNLMVSNNLRNGYILLESLGIRVDETTGMSYSSNIIEI